MTIRRSVGCGLALVVLLPACVSTAEVPWPPAPGSCIEAHREGVGRRAPWHYAIQGQPAGREEVERLVDRSPAMNDRFRAYRIMNVLSPALGITGDATMIGGVVAGGATHRPLLYVISVVGLVILAAAVGVGMSTDDPFREAIWQYNEETALQRSGVGATGGAAPRCGSDASRRGARDYRAAPAPQGGPL